MGRNIRLPKRINNVNSELTEMQKVFLDCYILGIGDSRILFKALLAPADSDRVAMNKMSSLVKNSDAFAYMESRKAQLEKHYFDGVEIESESSDDDDISISEAREIIYRAVSKDLIRDIRDGNVEYKRGSIVEKLINKILEDDTDGKDTIEPPRLYLPESCNNCRYRKFIEEDGNVEDECKYCNYKKNCLERGIEYNQKEQFNFEEKCQ